MFNSKLKNEALLIHERAVSRYDASYKRMMEESSRLYDIRTKSIELLTEIEELISSIASKPQEFEKKVGMVREEKKRFKDTEEFAEEALKGEIAAGIGVAASVAAGGAVASMAPTVAMHIATTFGKASTGVAIKALSGAAAQKAALAWLGGGALSAGGAGIAGGKALLALAGPVGWSLTAASTGISLIALSNKNKKIANDARNKAKELMEAKEILDETGKKIEKLREKTVLLHDGVKEMLGQLCGLKGENYLELSTEEQIQLGTLVNNALSLASLVNTVIS